MAELLSMKIPSSYEVLFPDGPVRAAVVEAKKVESDMAGECPSCPRVPPVSLHWHPRDGLSILLPGMLGGKEKALAGKVPDSSSEWLKQFDAVLPGYSLKGELDLLTLLRQVSGVQGAPMQGWEVLGYPQGCVGVQERGLFVGSSHDCREGWVSPWDGAKCPRKESRRSLQGWVHVGC